MDLVSSFGVKCSIKSWLGLFVGKSRAETAADVISPVKKNLSDAALALDKVHS